MKSISKGDCSGTAERPPLEINSSPDARRAAAAGVTIAIDTDAHGKENYLLSSAALTRHGAPVWKNFHS
jgi:hypothetical protein